MICTRKNGDLDGFRSKRVWFHYITLYDLLTDIQWIRLRAAKEMFTIKYLTI